MDQFVGCIEPSEKMFFTPAYVQDPHALDHLLKYALPQLSAKNDLITTASQATLRTVFAAHSLSKAKTPELTWTHLATVVCTIVLDAVIERCEFGQNYDQHLASRQVAEAERERERRTSKAARKKAAAEAARRADKQTVTPLMADATPAVEELDLVSTTVGGSSSVASFDSNPEVSAAWPSLSDLPCPRQTVTVRHTFVDFEDEAASESGARVRAASAEW
jgi:hypothetical protein